MDKMVFILELKARKFDTQSVVLTAVSAEDIDYLYDVAKRNVNDGYDLILKTFENGIPVEVSLYQPDKEDFKVIMCYEKE